jgi:hypothetical protein
MRILDPDGIKIKNVLIEYTQGISKNGGPYQSNMRSSSQ